MTGPATRFVRLIWNVNAGIKAGISTNSSTVEALSALMARHDLGADLVTTTTEDEAITATRDAVARQYDRVIAAGGDGTVAPIARELLGTRTALGLLPLGSVMNIARMLEIPRDLEHAAAIAATGVVQAIDVGEANGTLFFEAGSVGLNAAIFREAQRIDSGAYSSVLSSLWIMLRYRPARMRISLDDQTFWTRALMVTVANGPYTGLGFTVAPGARLDDGKLDVSVFSRFSRWELVKHFGAIAFGRRRYSPKVRIYRSARVRIESVHPLPCRADAHDLGTTPATFAVRPAALRVVVPGPMSGLLPGASDTS